MKQTYLFSISGMTCHACEKLITMDLAEAGFAPLSITHQPGELKIELEATAAEQVKKVIEASKTYTVTNIIQL